MNDSYCRYECTRQLQQETLDTNNPTTFRYMYISAFKNAEHNNMILLCSQFNLLAVKKKIGAHNKTCDEAFIILVIALKLPCFSTKKIPYSTKSPSFSALNNILSPPRTLSWQKDSFKEIITINYPLFNNWTNVRFVFNLLLLFTPEKLNSSTVTSLRSEELLPWQQWRYNHQCPLNASYMLPALIRKHKTHNFQF